MPVNYVYEDGFIYIHSAKEGHKIESINSFNRVCFTVVGSSHVVPKEFSTAYKSVVVFGMARILCGQQAVEPLRKIVRKYSPQHLDEAEKIIEKYLDQVVIIQIQIKHLQGKANLSF